MSNEWEMDYADLQFEQDWNAATDVGNYQEQYNAASDVGWEYGAVLDLVNETAFGGSSPSWYSNLLTNPAPSDGASDWLDGVNARSDQYMARQGLTVDSNDADKSEGLLSSIGEKLDKAGAWMEKNKKLSELIAGGIGGAVAAREKRKDREARTSDLRLQDELKQQADQRYSDSIKGLNKPTGMLYSGPLTRRSGQRVFDDNGRLSKV